MRKNQFDRDIVVILVATLVTLVAWVGVSVYLAYSKHDSPEIAQKYLDEFDPKLDTTVLDKLQQRTP